MVTISETAGPLQSHQKVTILPDFTLQDCPALDVLLVPGKHILRDPLDVLQVQVASACSIAKDLTNTAAYPYNPYCSELQRDVMISQDIEIHALIYGFATRPTTIQKFVTWQEDKG